LASITTDAGAYHLLDIRTDSRSMPTIVDTSKSDLYTHAYMRDTNVLLFGYGDGTISQFDLRVNKMYVGISQTQPRSRSLSLSLALSPLPRGAALARITIRSCARSETSSSAPTARPCW